MTDNNPAASTAQGEGSTNPPAPDNKETDWEAKYREAIAHSREWEKRAKDNKAAADELAALKENSLSETEKLTARAEKAEKALAEYQRAAKANEWRKAAAEKHGVPVDMLTETDEESINKQAESLEAWRKTLLAPSAPRVPKPSGSPEGKTGMTSDLVKQLFGR